MSQSAGKPNSVPRVLSCPSIRLDDHSSRPGIARGLQQPTRWPRTGRPSSQSSLRYSSLRHPIWSCSVRGFACHRRYRRRGALLPHLFTLTPCLALARLAARPRYGETTIPLDRRSLAGSSDLPGGRGRADRLACATATLFGLAPCGVLPANDVTAGAVRSYRTFSP